MSLIHPPREGERKGTTMFHPLVDKTQAVNQQYHHSHSLPPPQPPYLPHDYSKQYIAPSLVQRPRDTTVECSRACGRVIFILAFTIIIALSVLFMIYFILVYSHLLVFHVHHLEMSGLNALDPSLNIQWNTCVYVRNPNLHINFLIENALINLSYKDESLANSYHDRLQITSEELKGFQVDFKAANLSKEDDRVRDMMNEIEKSMVLQFNLAMSFQTTFSYEIINKNVKKYDMEAVCRDLELRFPPNYTTTGGGGVIRSSGGMSKYCSIKLKEH